MGSSLLIDIGSLLHAGRPISLDDSVAIPPFGSLAFPERARVVLDLRRVEKGLQIDGTIEARVASECDRCLDEVVIPLRVDVDERFDPPSGTSDPFGDNNVLNGTELDVGDLVRQLVTAALPFGLVCSDECRGLCATCGQSKNVGGGCHCPEMEGDYGKSEMEDSAIENTQPSGGELEARTGHHDRMPPVPSSEAAALRLPDMRDV
jgi:uncharacterized protein